MSAVEDVDFIDKTCHFLPQTPKKVESVVRNAQQSPIITSFLAFHSHAQERPLEASAISSARKRSSMSPSSSTTYFVWWYQTDIHIKAGNFRRKEEILSSTLGKRMEMQSVKRLLSSSSWSLRHPRFARTEESFSGERNVKCHRNNFYIIIVLSPPTRSDPRRLIKILIRKSTRKPICV